MLFRSPAPAAGPAMTPGLGAAMGPAASGGSSFARSAGVFIEIVDDLPDLVTEDFMIPGGNAGIELFVRNKRLLIKPFFQDKDKSKSGFVANTRFQSIFDTMKL